MKPTKNGYKRQDTTETMQMMQWTKIQKLCTERLLKNVVIQMFKKNWSLKQCHTSYDITMFFSGFAKIASWKETF